MKNKKKVILKLVIILFLMFLFIKIFILNSFSNSKNMDDFLFLKLISKNISYLENDENIKNSKVYEFKISYKDMNFKTIDLSKTVNKDTLLYEKIAPGTNGEFYILLDSNQDLKYKVEFNSINEKPYNLKFRALNDKQILGESSTLDELSEKLEGTIKKNKKINIKIEWYWDFENKEYEESTDIQDTKDSENIRKYQFLVYAFGEEIL